MYHKEALSCNNCGFLIFFIFTKFELFIMDTLIKLPKKDKYTVTEIAHALVNAIGFKTKLEQKRLLEGKKRNIYNAIKKGRLPEAFRLGGIFWLPEKATLSYINGERDRYTLQDGKQAITHTLPIQGKDRITYIINTALLDKGSHPDILDNQYYWHIPPCQLCEFYEENHCLHCEQINNNQGFSHFKLCKCYTISYQRTLLNN